MALVVPRRLLNTFSKSKFVPKITVQPYHCYILTKHEIRHHNFIPGYLRTSANDNCCTMLSQLRLYSASSNVNIDKNEEEKKKKSIFKRFKEMYRDYWYVLVPVHLVTSAGWFAGFYYLARSGVDIPSLLETLKFSERIVQSMQGSSMGYFAITYGLYKIATPVRYAVTLGGTTVSINYLTKWGYIKPVPSKERLKEMINETKEGIKEKRENLMESVQSLQQTVKDTKEGIKETKDNIVSTVKESKESIKSIKEKVIGPSTQKQEDKP